MVFGKREGKKMQNERIGEFLKKCHVFFIAAASEFSRGAFHALVVDTDSGAFSMGFAREIANRMQAYYVEML